MILGLTACIGLAAAGGRTDQEHTLGPVHEPLTLEVGDADPVLPGHGRSVSVERTLDADGTLYVWAESEDFDAFLRAEDIDGARLGEDDDSGGGRTPCLELEVESGQELRIHTAVTTLAGTGAVTLHLCLAPSEPVAREAAEGLREALQELAERISAGGQEGAREDLAALIDELVHVEGAEESAELTRLAWNAAVHARRLGDLRAAASASRLVITHRERHLPPTHPDLCRARYNLAATSLQLGDVRTASELFEQLVAVHEHTPPADPVDGLRAGLGLAMAIYRRGELAESLALLEQLVERYEQVLPPGGVELTGVRLNLATTLSTTGDLERAREVAELALRRSALPREHPLAIHGMLVLGAIRGQLGDTEGSRELLGRVLELQLRTLPGDHPAVLATKLGLAAAHERMGDLEGARELLEPVVAAYERDHAPDHPELLRARGNLAMILLELGDPAGALELQDEICSALAESLPEDHPDRLQAQLELALALKDLGRLDQARDLEERAVRKMEESLPADHPNLLRARGGLAVTLKRLGDLPAALSLEEQVLDGYVRTHEPGHPRVLSARLELALTRLRSGDARGAGELIGPLVLDFRARLSAGLDAPPREAGAIAAADGWRLSGLLLLAAELGEDVASNRDLFDLIELRRQLATTWIGARGSRGGDPELEVLRSSCARARRLLSERTRQGPGDGEETETWRRDVARLALARDAAQGRLSEALRERGRGSDPFEVDPLLSRLDESSAAVGFLCYDRWDLDVETRTISSGHDALLAGVLRHDGTLTRVELGEASVLEGLVRDWREALGRPPERGTMLDPTASDLERRAGSALRRSLLDPVLQAAGLPAGGGTLRVCLDGFLHLVPLDALPLEDGGRVGDRYEIRLEGSFASPASVPPRAEGPTMLLVGDVDFDAELEGSGDVPAASAGPTVEVASRSSSFGRWERLFGTKGEIEALAVLFQESSGVEPQLLRRAQVTKPALTAAVVGREYVHLATHGWFVPESERPRAEPAADESLGRRLDQTVRGFAPLTLCGLCLAGANQGRDDRGRVPGLLTAEELAGLDLSGCALAVLSACETNVGIHRSGQGIHSLQSALHAAGARAAITSLWRVPDDQTKELMIALYTNLWDRHMPPAKALWLAKRRLRDDGYPVSSWAPWVLTGQAD